MRKPITTIITFLKDFAYGIHAGNAIRLGMAVPQRKRAVR
ncbi:hypothetical protein YIM_33570 [Amycolatopsis sp. YIM 10]|nr:hypothetical protein YIM_33570 [Amycolatopsis sp. YIM 10]